MSKMEKKKEGNENSFFISLACGIFGIVNLFLVISIGVGDSQNENILFITSTISIVLTLFGLNYGFDDWNNYRNIRIIIPIIISIIGLIYAILYIMALYLIG